MIIVTLEWFCKFSKKCLFLAHLGAYAMVLASSVVRRLSVSWITTSKNACIQLIFGIYSCLVV